MSQRPPSSADWSLLASTVPSPAAPGSTYAAEGEQPLASAPLDVVAALRGEPLRILFVAAEGAPYIKTGGMADVIGALPRALERMGHDVRIALPRYKNVDPERWGLSTVAAALPVPVSSRTELVDVAETEQSGGVRVIFVDAPHYFQREKLYGYNDDGERFILFSRAVLEYCRAVGWSPDIIHCHDWHTAIIPNWTKTLYRDDPIFASTATVYTVHNLAYQGIFGYRILEVAGVAEEGFLYPDVPELANVVDLMGRGILFADVISTVSPRYAREILTPEYGERLDPLLRERQDRLYGILNGIDTEQINPLTDGYLAQTYDAFTLDRRAANKRALQQEMRLPVAPRVPLLALISRLIDQKGLDLIAEIAVPLLEQGIQLVVSGSGDSHYHQYLQRLAARYPDQVALNLSFGARLSERICAGADMLLMPSRFEPCGQTQMVAMRYGCIPIVHRTGGLADTVQEFDPVTEKGNGFSFTRYDAFHLFGTIMRAVEAYKFQPQWEDLMQRAMLADYSWDASAERYVALYRRAQELQHLAAARLAATTAGTGIGSSGRHAIPPTLATLPPASDSAEPLVPTPASPSTPMPATAPVPHADPPRA